MRWSKLKQMCEARMAPSLAGRVALHITGYTGAHDQQGRGWITVDGSEVASFCNLAANVRHWQVQQLDPHASRAIREAHLRAEGVRSGDDFFITLRESLQMPLEAMLTDDDMLLRALAMLDRRLGKRRLRQMQIDTEHPLVYHLYALRCTAEGITPQPIRFVA